MQGDFGERHIERPERLSQLKGAGFLNARDFVESICNNFDEFYDVITAMITRRKSILNKAAKQKIRLLWQKAQ